MVERTASDDERFGELMASLDAVEVGDLDFARWENEALTELVRCLPRIATKLEAVSMKAMASWDGRELWAVDGTRSGGAWLAGNTTMAGSTAREKLRVAGSMGDMPATEDAFQQGEVSYTQLRQLQRVATDDDTKDAFAKREQQLLDRVKKSPADETGRLVDAWRHRHTPRAGVDEIGRASCRERV